MPRTNTVVVGAGHAGLAMSRCLTDRGVAHVVLEGGCVGERWRTSCSDAFRLLTPNWLSRLPGWEYRGPEPDGFMTAGELVGYLSDYARSFHAPLHLGTTVTRVAPGRAGFLVETERGTWSAANVVVATGYHVRAKVPGTATRLASDIAQLTPSGYRSPAGLPDGDVLVVGASASGVQIAHELAGAGRRVHLAVGSHTRLPRSYRGRDILWWLDRLGSLERDLDQVPDVRAARSEPSLQLVGTPDGRRIDLGVLQDAGVRLVGRLRALEGTTAAFADDLTETVGLAQGRLARVLGEIDRYASATPGAAAGPPDPPPPVVAAPAPSRLDLRRSGVTGVVWATGYRPTYPWLELPVLDGDGRIRSRRGVTAVPGLYAIGLRFQYRRNSTFIDGARHDAVHLAEHIVANRAPRLAV